jgi:transcriptional regulator with XRE-family HTH domain
MDNNLNLEVLMKVEKYHNWELDRAIRESGIKQAIVAEKAGLDTGTLSHIKRGRIRPTDEEEKAIAKALKMPVDKIFIRAESMAA